MSDLRELYQEVIIDHSKNPRNFGKPKTANREAEGFNPLCGDKLTLYLYLEDDVIIDVGFAGCGCAISTASASLMTEAVKGRTMAEAENLFHRFHEVLTENGDSKNIGKLEILAGVKEFPMRVKCATLAWHTLNAALHNDVSNPVTTE